MGNSRKYQFLFSKVPMLEMIQGIANIGAAGAVSSFSGANVSSVSLLHTGVYKIQLVENYNAWIGSHFQMVSPTTGGPVADGSFVTNTLYQITVVGTTNWYAVGLDPGLTPAVGQQFVATGAWGAGTGTATAVGQSGIVVVEACNPAQMLQNSVQGKGAIMLVQTLNDADALANPVNGSAINFQIWMRNSSVAF